MRSNRDLLLFFTGRLTSLTGSQMAGLAVTFAVLRRGGSAADVGFVQAARIASIVVFLLIGGVIADRLGPRRVMLTADALRCAVQATFAVLLFTGRPPIWVFVVLVSLWGIGEGFFLPAISAMVPAITPDKERLQQANALVGLANSISTAGGPVVAGVIVALAGTAVCLAVDAASFAVSAVALLMIRAPHRSPEEPTGMFHDLRAGWAEVRSRRWMWTTTLQFTLMNMLVWAPFLVLGPVIAHERLGGSWAWGLIMTCYGAGAVGGGLVMLRVPTPRRPLLVATIATFGFALVPGALALGLPVDLVAVAALATGVGMAVDGAIMSTVQQRHVPAEALARASSYTALGSFGLGPLGLVLAGVLGDHVGPGTVLGFGAAWQVLSCLLLLAVPDVRRLRPAP